MSVDIKKRTKAKILLKRFFVPGNHELAPLLLISLFILLVASYRVLLVLLADGTPITDLSFGDVYGDRIDYVLSVLQIPLLGRIVLFLFWLAVGSVVYMMVWLFQNFAIEVYDDITHSEAPTDEDPDSEGWWGTTLSHTIFVGSSVIIFLFFILISLNIVLPAAAQLFQVGVQTITTFDGWLKIIFAMMLTSFTLHIYVLFWDLFKRIKSFIYNSY